MSRTETIVDTVAITVMLFGIFIGYISWVGETAESHQRHTTANRSRRSNHEHAR